MEMSLGCDNLLCDALGRAPSCRLVVWVRNESEEAAMTASSVSSSSNSLETMWRKYCQTEVVKKSSNPSFMRTTVFRESDGVDDKLCRIKVSAHDMRERFTSTTTLLGTATTSFQELKTKGDFFILDSVHYCYWLFFADKIEKLSWPFSKTQFQFFHQNSVNLLKLSSKTEKLSFSEISMA